MHTKGNELSKIRLQDGANFDECFLCAIYNPSQRPLLTICLVIEDTAYDWSKHTTIELKMNMLLVVFFQILFIAKIKYLPTVYISPILHGRNFRSLILDQL